MTATDRRQAILDYLLLHRRATRQQLMDMFNVGERTIDRDIIALSCTYPIDTVPGRAGGVVIEDGYHLGKQYLDKKQEDLIRQLTASATDNETRATLQSILDKFAHKGVKK